jgi:phage shock protein A
MVMEQAPEDLRGMNPAEAKEYIFHYITALKLSEKKRDELAGDRQKWLDRVGLARSRDAEDLARAAQGEADKLRTEMEALDGEIAELKAVIRRMREQLPGLAARERRIDPDLLEQELLMVLGDGGDAELERRFEAVKADAALEALKATLNQDEKS